MNGVTLYAENARLRAECNEQRNRRFEAETALAAYRWVAAIGWFAFVVAVSL